MASCKGNKGQLFPLEADTSFSSTRRKSCPLYADIHFHPVRGGGVVRIWFVPHNQQVHLLSCMDNATSYQTACCGVIDNVAILHWLNIISYAYHHDMFVIIMNKTLYNLYIKTTTEDKTKVYAIHMSGELQPNKTKSVCNTHIRINTTKQDL